MVESTADDQKYPICRDLCNCLRYYMVVVCWHTDQDGSNADKSRDRDAVQTHDCLVRQAHGSVSVKGREYTLRIIFVRLELSWAVRMIRLVNFQERG